MIININSWPGVGKLTIAEKLVEQIGGRLLDNHTIFNVAFSLCEFRTPPFYEAVRAVRTIAFERAAALPLEVPLTLTSAYANTPFGVENWTAIRAMADQRGSPLCVVVLDCSLAENTRRLQSPERASRRKLVDPGPLTQARQAASYDVLGPVGLGREWRATSVRSPREDGGLSWHIGFVTPRGDYAGLEQSDGPPAREFVDRFAEGSRATGDVRLAGRTWERREGGEPDPRTLVLRTDTSTVLVTGTAEWSELEALAGSLAVD